jgi:hypothetical protein
MSGVEYGGFTGMGRWGKWRDESANPMKSQNILSVEHWVREVGITMIRYLIQQKTQTQVPTLENNL